jgi:two-component system OmpR family response regulator
MANRTPHILVVDDDREIRRLLERYLAEHGFRVSTAADGRQMMRTLALGRIELIVLDLMLPGEDGLGLCRRVRQASQVPILMLTAVAAETDRIIGLELGADDYLSKPFNPRELVARIRAILRRGNGLAEAQSRRGEAYAFEGWRLNRVRRELQSPDGVLVPLSRGEIELLLAFVEHPQRVLNRDQLLDLAYGRSGGLFDRSIDVQVSRLRHKIEADPAQPKLIKTVRGDGYLFAAEVKALESALEP